MKIRSVTIGDALIVLLIASSTGNQKSAQLHHTTPSALNSYSRADKRTGIAGTAYPGKKRTLAENRKSWMYCNP